VKRWRCRKLAQVRRKAKVAGLSCPNSPGKVIAASQPFSSASPGTMAPLCLSPRQQGPAAKALPASEVVGLSPAEISAASAALANSNDALELEKLALQRYVASLQERLRTEEAHMGSFMSFLGCCTNRP